MSTDSINQETNSINAFDNNYEYMRDAFGKLRISFPTTILDIRFPYVPSSYTPSSSYLTNNQLISLNT